MSEKEYLGAVEKIREQIKLGRASEVLQELDELYEIKPVRLRWIVAKAESMMSLGYPTSEVYRFLNQKAYLEYNYDGAQECLEIYYKLAEENSDYIEMKRIKYHSILLKQENIWSHSEKEYIYKLKSEFEKSISEFLDDMSNNDKLLKLRELTYIREEYTLYAFLSILGRLKIKENETREWVMNLPNMGYLCSLLEQDNKHSFIVVISEDNRSECEIIINLLEQLKQKVYVLEQPIQCEVDYEIDMRETINISLDNVQSFGDIDIICPVEIVYNNTIQGNNKAILIDYLINNKIEKKLATIISGKKYMAQLEEEDILKKQLQILSGDISEHIEDTIVFGWVGNYLQYISYIYEIDVDKEINQPAEYDFSIVIPARNSAESLRYTLQTCLNQRYKGKYEIILSDNSTDGNNEVYNLYTELNDPHINYCRTPRELPLSKSFEYAFLQAKGEFVFSIGSDDGILPWALEILDRVIKQHPNQDIISWERGFYGWPGFDEGKEHQFIIPATYKKDEVTFNTYRGTDILLTVLKNLNTMYSLPMLYINSGYRRRYIKKLYSKTGRLWDGICQDLYIGIVNTLINDYILQINYPITIAGMTKASEGAKSNRPSIKQKDLETHIGETIKINNMGGFSSSNIERLMPPYWSDRGSLYNSILRMVARGVLSKQVLGEIINWKKLYIDCLELLNAEDLLFDMYIHQGQFIAMKHDREFEKWFNDKVYPILMRPRYLEKNKKQAISYVEGESEDGGIILNASKYDVTNIYEATKLFEKVTGL